MNPIKRILGHLYFAYGMLLFTATMLVVVLPIAAANLWQEPRRAKIVHVLFNIWMRIFMPLVGCFVIRKGAHHFKKGQNYVVVCNHNSLVDIPVSSPWIPGPNKTLAKAEMAAIPLFGIIYKTGSILVNRQDDKSRSKSYNDMIDALRMGLHLCLYPEGTRNKSQQPLQRFYDGAFRVAIASQKPIIPALIFNTKKILPNTPKFWAWPHTIHFHFLVPIETKGLALSDTEELKTRVHQIMSQYYASHC